MFELFFLLPKIEFNGRPRALIQVRNTCESVGQLIAIYLVYLNLPDRVVMMRIKDPSIINSIKAISILLEARLHKLFEPLWQYAFLLAERYYNFFGSVLRHRKQNVRG